MKPFFFPMIFMGALTLAPWAFGAPAVNLLKNGDFEMADGEKLTDWKVTSAGGTATASEAGAFAQGRLSAFLKSTSEDPGVRAPVTLVGAVGTVNPETSYQLSFFARSEKPGQVLVAIIYTDPEAGGKHWYRRKEFPLSASWKKYSFETAIPPADEWNNKKVSVFFQVASGSAFVDGAVLAPVVAAAAEGSLRKNILENPGFDDGISGWFLEYWSSTRRVDERTLHRDESVKHSGGHSLKMPDNGASILSRRYPFKPNTSYTLSFYLKGEKGLEGEGVRAFVITPNWKIFKTDIPPTAITPEWKRHTVTFKCPGQSVAYENTFYVRIDPRATVWVDSLQLEEGDLSDFDPGVQVGLEPGGEKGLYQKGEKGTLRVSLSSPQALREKVELSVWATGADGLLKWAFTNSFAPLETRVNQPISFPTENLGVFDVQARATGPAGQVLAGAQWRLAVVAGPLALPPNPLIGIDLETAQMPLGALREEEGFSQAIGAGFSRTFFNPRNGERTNWSWKNREDLVWMKAGYDLEKGHGKEVMVDLQPDRDSPLNFHNMRKLGRPYPPAERQGEIARFAQKAAELVVAFSNQFDVVEVLNEPNIWIIDGNKVMGAEAYGEILKAVYRAIKGANPRVKVAANINGIDHEYVEQLFKGGFGAFLDLLTVHAYRATAENPPIYEDLQKMRGILNNFRPGMPMVNSEQYFGVRNLISQHEYERNYFADAEEDHAGRLIQTLLHGVAAGQTPFGLFLPPGTLVKSGIGEAPFYYHFFSVLRRSSETLRDIEKGQELESAKALRVFLFEKKDGSRLVTANTRVYGVAGTLKLGLGAQGVFDALGNALLTEDVPVGFLPVTWQFAREVPLGEIKKAFAHARCRGFDFPVEMVADVGPQGSLSLQLRNVGTSGAKGSVTFPKPLPPWTLPATVPFDLGPQQTTEKTLALAPAPISWSQPLTLNYSAQVDDLVVSRSLRIPVLTIARAQTKLAIDGDLADWKETTWCELGEKQLSKNFGEKWPHKGSADLSARVAYRYEEGGLYLAVQVTDDVFYRDPKLGPMYQHLNDSVQVYFDLGNTAKPGDRSYGKEVVSYSLGLGPEGEPTAYLEKGPGTRYVGADNAEQGLDREVKIAHRRSGTGYVIEAFFPSFTLPFLAFKPESQFAVAVLVNDNDGEGRKQGVTMTPAGTEPYSEPWLWPWAKLGR